MDYESFCENLKCCVGCGLCRTRQNVVVGDGAVPARVLFIGEAPGQNEDEQGLPFVGRSGKLLRNTIETLGFSSEDYHIDNIVRCRPPNNRDPKEDELLTCMPYLVEKIRRYIKPELIVCLGRIPSRLIKEDYVQKNDHGRVFEKNGIKWMGTYHPSAAIRKKEWKQFFENDIRFAYQILYENAESDSRKRRLSVLTKVLRGVENVECRK